MILEVFHTESTPAYELRQRVIEILVAADEPPALSIEDFQAALQEVARLRAAVKTAEEALREAGYSIAADGMMAILLKGVKP
jgi:DnaJ-domain-containing protein 1